MQTLQEYIVGTTSFIGDVLLPLLFSFALLFFVWNAFKYFIYGAGDKDAQESARRLALYGIAAFVVLVSIWGIVNLLINGLGLNDDSYVIPDYLWNDPFYHEDYSQTEYCNNLNPGATDCR